MHRNRLDQQAILWILVSLLLTLAAGAQAQSYPQQSYPGMQTPGMPGPMGTQVGPMEQPRAPEAVTGSVAVHSRLVTVHTGRSSYVRARRIQNQIGAHLLLQLAYQEVAPGAGSRTAGTPGLSDARSFEKSDASGTRVIELAVTRGPAGLHDVLVFGATESPAGESDNPDLALLEPVLLPLVMDAAPVVSGPTSTAYAWMNFQLSYTQADQAIALLKALGYSTVEFNKQPGESAVQSIYDPISLGQVQVPYVIKFLDAPKTSLMDPAPSTSATPGMPPGMPQQMGGGFGGGRSSTAIPDIGGTFLHTMTSGEPAQRLMIVYDPERPDALETLINVLQEQIDVPAKQVVISALIVEINSNRARDLGVTFQAGNGQTEGSFLRNPQTGEQQPFTFTFDRRALITPTQFRATLSALVSSGEAEILSNPSVLVLDGRQARIQIGKQVPVVNSTSTAAGITSSVEYFPVGIVLNLRPRITEDNSEVTMQVETIVSAVSQTSVSTSQVFFAPTIDNRQVQTFVRVADSTPFIIGGLISSDRQSDREGIPLLSRIPMLGSLFRRTTESRSKREVIVVLTPHIVPLDEKSFSYVIPKDSDTFDTFGYQLFRNAYRIRNRDVFDLGFIYESQVFQQLLARVRQRATEQPGMRRTEPYASLLAGRIPGEEILVRRMMWEIIRRLEATKDLSDERIIFFEPSANDPEGTDFTLAFFKQKVDAIGSGGSNALVLTFDATNQGTLEHPFVQPKAHVSYETIPAGMYERVLRKKNRTAPDGTPQQWAIVISNEYTGTAHPLEVLRNVMVLKRLLALNASMPLTIAGFHVGRQIIFPTEQDITQSFHVIDRDAARLFYEVSEYYRAFEQEFTKRTRAVAEEMK